MGIFARVSDIIAANVNALLDKAENPEKMIGQIILEMEEGLANARRYAATAIAAERRIGRELEQNRAQAEFWKNKARAVLPLKREDLARRMLGRKQEHEDLVQSLEGQHAQAVQTSAQVRTSLRALEARLAEARRKRRSLLARHAAAKVRVSLQRMGAEFPDFHNAQTRFDRLESRLEDYEDETAALAEFSSLGGRLEGEVIDLERERAVTEELEELRREMGLG
jgi:phage shock protein A